MMSKTLSKIFADVMTPVDHVRLDLTLYTGPRPEVG